MEVLFEVLLLEPDHSHKFHSTKNSKLRIQKLNIGKLLRGYWKFQAKPVFFLFLFYFILFYFVFFFVVTGISC